MPADKSLSGVAAEDDAGVGLSDPNVITATVPDGAIWYVEDVIVDGKEPIRSAVIVDEDNMAPGAAQLWQSLGTGPFGVAVDPDGATVYVTDFGAGETVALDAADGSQQWSQSGTGPFGVAVDSDGATVYVTDFGAGETVALDAADGSQQWSQSGSSPESVAVDSDGATVYVADRDAGETVALDAADGSQQWSQSGSSPEGVAVDPDGSQQWSQSGTGPFGVAVDSDGATVYVADRGDGETVALVDTPLDAAHRSTDTVGGTTLDRYAYGGDTVGVAVHRPRQATGYRLGIREVLSP